MSLESAARAALSRPGILGVHFQPIVDLSRGVVAGYEALARFAGPPATSPDQWFAAAHAAGFGEELEARALRSALSSRGALPENAFLTVNLGPAAATSEEVRSTLAGFDDLRGVIFEITEQQAVADYGALRDAVTPLRERGALLAVDDAGAGFASLQHITQLRPDLIKVDRGLVASVDRDPTRAAVVETLGIFASRLDAWLLAEGVETASELGRIMSLSVPLAQGYFLGRPAAAMGGLAPQARDLHANVSVARRTGSDLAGLIEPAHIVRGPITGIEDPGRDLCHWMVVDEYDRPVELVMRRSGAPRPSTPMQTTLKDAAVDVVRRAIARPDEERFDPIAVCDELGRLIGIVTIERLVGQLADSVDTPVLEQRAAA